MAMLFNSAITSGEQQDVGLLVGLDIAQGFRKVCDWSNAGAHSFAIQVDEMRKSALKVTIELARVIPNGSEAGRFDLKLPGDLRQAQDPFCAKHQPALKTLDVHLDEGDGVEVDVQLLHPCVQRAARHVDNFARHSLRI